MRGALWDAEAAAEAAELLAGSTDDYAVLVVDRPEGGLGAFAEVGKRSYAEGCSTSPVGYLEGIWVDPDWRRTSVGRTLVDAALQWARGQGLSEFASDCALDNDVSYAFHRALGFVETDRVICFARPIPDRRER